MTRIVRYRCNDADALIVILSYYTRQVAKYFYILFFNTEIQSLLENKHSCIIQTVKSKYGMQTRGF